jgi:hypothetical protein
MHMGKANNPVFKQNWSVIEPLPRQGCIAPGSRKAQRDDCGNAAQWCWMHTIVLVSTSLCCVSEKHLLSLLAAFRFYSLS